MKLVWKDRSTPNFSVIRDQMHELHVLHTGSVGGWLTRYKQGYGQVGCLWHYTNGKEGTWLDAASIDEAKTAAEVIWRMQQ
jgi:hypothetical protein